MVRRGAPQRVVAWAATTSWIAPLAALILVGVSERASALLPVPTTLLLAFALGGAIPGLAIGVGAALGSESPGPRRNAIFGIGLSVTTLVVLGTATVTGATSGRETERAIQGAVDDAARNFPGWNGGALFDGVTVSASGIDPRAELARLVLRGFDAPYRVVMIGVDDRLGPRDVVVDLHGARLKHSGNVAPTPCVSRDEPPLRVAAGNRADQMWVFFPVGVSLTDVVGLEVVIDGMPRDIPGRYFTLDEKRAIDARRGH